MTLPGSPVRVAVVAPIRSMRIGLAAMLSGSPGIEVALQAVSLDEALSSPARFDVLLLAVSDPLLPDFNRFFAALEDPPALVLMAAEPLPLPLPDGFARRPWSVISIDSSPDDLALAVQAAARGLWLADPALLSNMLRPSLAAPVNPADAPVEALTGREIEVLQQLAQGLANKQIAANLHLSENTIKFHISSIYAKLGAGNRAEAVRLGARLGYITI